MWVRCITREVPRKLFNLAATLFCAILRQKSAGNFDSMTGVGSFPNLSDVTSRGSAIILS